MTEFLLDTNVISELAKPRHRRRPEVVRWLEAHRGQCWLSVVTILEISRGIAALRHRQAARAARLDAWFARIRHGQSARLVAVDERIAHLAGEWMAAHRLTTEDALIAATASRRGLVCVTGNLRHIGLTGIEAIDPALASAGS